MRNSILAAFAALMLLPAAASADTVTFGSTLAERPDIIHDKNLADTLFFNVSTKNSHQSPVSGQILAVRVKGRFSRVQARSVPKQQPPYPPLSEVARQQVIFEWNDLDATLVGFRFPASARGYELVGYHWHVLSDDRARGGHLLDCTMISGVVEFNRADELHVEIPAGLSWRSPQPDAARDAVLERLERSVQRSSV